MAKRGGSWLVPLAVLAGMGVVYSRWLRPRHLQWGAGDDELQEILPGDDLVPDANLSSTRAIDIAAPASEVWGWLVQIGQGRAGFYSYDWLENLAGLEMRSADAIRPEWGELHVGQTVAMEPGGSGATVAAVKPGRLLALYASGEDGGALGEALSQAAAATSWVFVLRDTPYGGSRLTTRWRARYHLSRARTPMAFLVGLLLEPVVFVMERRMLLGIKERAERRARLQVTG